MRASLGSIAELGGGRFRIRVAAGYDKTTGKRVSKDVTIRGSRRDAERELSRILIRIGKAQPGKMTVQSYLEEVWLPSKDVRQKTREGYAAKIRVCIVPYLGDLQLQAIKPYTVERWLNDLKVKHPDPQTRKHARSVLKNAMRDAVRWEIIEHDPTEGSPCPAVRYTPKVLDGAQMNAYLDAFAGHVVEPVVILMIALGLRRSEACALDWADIDFSAGTVDIHRGIHQDGARVWYEPTKSENSNRLLAMPDWALDALRPLRGVGPLVPDLRGLDGRMPPTKVARLYKERVTSVEGLPYVPIRNLRNSHGTWLYDSGVELGRIADQLGHSTTEITRKHYVERSHRQANRTTAAVVQSLRSTQLDTIDSSKHEQNQTDIVVGEE